MAGGLAVDSWCKNMSTELVPQRSPVRQLAQQVRSYGPALLTAAYDPHAELMAMVWGPRFDREHAMSLWARVSHNQADAALPMLQVLLAAADCFDMLTAPAQQRLRRLIQRHQAHSHVRQVKMITCIAFC